MGWRNIFRSSVFECLKSPPRFARSFIGLNSLKISEFCDHYFSIASNYIIAKLDKAPVVDTYQILF